MDPQSRAIFRQKDLKILYGGSGIGDDYELYTSRQPLHVDTSSPQSSKLIPQFIGSRSSSSTGTIWVWVTLLAFACVIATTLWPIRKFIRRGTKRIALSQTTPSNCASASSSASSSPTIASSPSFNPYDQEGTLPPPVTEKVKH